MQMMSFPGPVRRRKFRFRRAEKSRQGRQIDGVRLKKEDFQLPGSTFDPGWQIPASDGQTVTRSHVLTFRQIHNRADGVVGTDTLDQRI